MAFWTRIFAVLGAGAAARSASRAVDPVIEVVGQDAWQANPFRVLEVDQLAALLAQALVSHQTATDQASRSGYDSNKLDALVQLALKGPPVAEALELWRRGKITQAQAVHALEKAQIEPQYHTPILDLFFERLDPAVVATAIQRGIMNDPGFLPPGGSDTGGVVPSFPVSPLDPLQEAQASGIDDHRLFVETAIVGLPPAPGELLQLLNRGVIQDPDFYRGVKEGNTRIEWGPALINLRRRILTPHEYAELRLRGWIGDPEMYAGAALSGLNQTDTDLLHNMLGRPIPEHQVVTGESRGGSFNGPTANIPVPFLRSLQQSNIRPEWYSLAYANRYSYPSAFVLRSLTQGGDITQAESEQILLDIGWRPDLAQKVSARWAGGTGAATDPHVSKAENQLWTTTHKVFVLGDADEGQARSMLGRLAIPGPAQDQIIALWDAERTLRRKELTDAALRKAVKGQQMTRQEALDELVARGYTTEDANIFLDQSPKPA